MKHPSLRTLTNILVLASLSGAVMCAPFAQAGIRVGNMAADRVLFLGNSITHHPPKPEIGWTGDWGMDASSQAKDYAHLVASAIAAMNGGSQPALQAVNVVNYGGFEQNYGPGYDVQAELRTLLDWHPDILVAEIGDNVTASLTTPEARTAFADSYHDVLAAFRGSGTPEVFVVSTFWASGVTDSILHNACNLVDGVYVDISSLYANPANRGGWGGHPNDTGMAAIADHVWDTMVVHSVPEPTPFVLAVCGMIGAAAYAWRKRG
jgi:hypothetical protein